MVSQDRIIGIFLALLGVATIIWVVPDSADDMGGYEMAVDANVLPMAAMAVFTGLAVLLALFGGNRQKVSGPAMDRHSWMYLLLLTAMLFIFLAGLNYLGFIPAGILCILAFMLLMGQRSIFAILITSVSLPLVMYFIIRQLLNIPLP